MMGRISVAACAALLLLAGCATQTPAPDAGLVPLQILAVNDFHGNLEPPSGGFSTSEGVSVPAGGAEHLATAVSTLRATEPNTIMVAAGDLIGASPLLSSLFHDEPAIESLSSMGLALAAVGNHEFDEGADELRRMQSGGCHPVDGCQGPHTFAGAGFDYLAASTIDRRTRQTVFPGVAIREFGGVKVGFIGLTLEGTPGLISPEWAGELEFRDEAETVNALVPSLHADGVEAIVVLIHEGGETTGGYNDCEGVSGPIVDIVSAFDPAVDIVVTGHTHQAYNCRIDGRLVTSAGRYGMALTKIDAMLDPETGDFASAAARNLIVAHADYRPDAAQTALLADYRVAAAPLMNREVGSVPAPLSRAANAGGESALGDVIADAQLEAGAAEGAVIAFMNPGGIREDIRGRADGTVVFNDLYTAQPFGNGLVAGTMTGAQIDALLEQQFRADGGMTILQVSDGFSYEWDASAPVGDKVSGVTLHGGPIDPMRDYRIVLNSFLSTGGDGFTEFLNARDEASLIVDVDALEDYFGAHSPVAPGLQDRIVRVD